MADLMHSLEEGLFKLVLLECILGLLPDSAKHKTDLLVSQWFTEKGSNRSGERLNFPRVSFTRGFCTPTLLSADERVGQLFFVLALLFYSKEGRAVMETRFDSKFDINRANGAGPLEEDGSQHKEVDECAIYSGSRKEQDVTGIFPVAVVDWLDRNFRPLWLEQQSSQPLRIQLLTEIKLLDPETQTFSHIVRAHPNYRNEGCWYDYVEIDYGSDGKFPARCAAFFQWPPILKHPEGDVDFQFLEDTGDDLG
jgi:hypothetical protein